MDYLEEFSVTELADFRRYSRLGNDKEVKDLVATNLAISGFRDRSFETEYPGDNEDRVLSTLVHDAVVEAYRNNTELDEDGFYRFISSSMNEMAEDAESLDTDILLRDNVYGRSLSDAVEDISGYYADNFTRGLEVETEKVLENNGFFGRADILREIDGEMELRDIKTRYSENIAVPGPLDEFKMGCYALLSKNDEDIDRFVLEYPVQGVEVDVEPEDWLGEVSDTAKEFEELLEDSRERQAELLRERLGLKEPKNPREFVEGRALGYQFSRELAESAFSEGLK